MTETISQFWGRCHTIRSERGFRSREYATVSLANSDEGGFAAPLPVYAFAHEPGEEFFVKGDNFPFDVETVTLEEGADCYVDKKVCHFPTDLSLLPFAI